jgi:diaminopropionate ammonia-lyase
MHSFPNPFRHAETLITMPAQIPAPSVNAAAPAALLARCPVAKATPLVDAAGLAKLAGVTSVHVKDERDRMGLGSFKALGAAYVIAHDAAAIGGDDLSGVLAGRTYVSASAGNHGLSVAAGAKVFGAKAVIYLAKAVPESFAVRLRDMGADVVRAGTNYAQSMETAMADGDANGWTLLSDTSWDEYYEVSHRLMEGYCVLMDEVFAQMPAAPTHILLQAGVGGLAGAAAAMARSEWGDAPQIIVVEPEFAPALIDSIKAGHCVLADGPTSEMGRLDCKEPSLIALKGLATDADVFVTISEDEAQAAMPVLAAHDLACSTSGGAGLVALLVGLGLPTDARVLAVLSEGVA